MSLSRQEEIIAALWIICAVLAFGFKFTTFGWIFFIKGLTDLVGALWFGIDESRESRRRK